MTLAIRQTIALLIDAVRRLRAAKLFWITLGLSLLVAASFALVGINSVGLHFPFYGTWQNGLFNTTILPADAFYKLLFLILGVSIWLSWASIILALISTADLIPSLASDGSADLYLSRPVGRVRLLLTRYATGLLFAAAQAACFSVAAIFVIGLRGGVWLPGSAVDHPGHRPVLQLSLLHQRPSRPPDAEQRGSHSGDAARVVHQLGH